MDKAEIRYFRRGMEPIVEALTGGLTQQKLLEAVKGMRVGDEIMVFVPNYSGNASMPSIVFSYYGLRENPKLYIIAPKQLKIQRMHSAQIRPVRMCVVERDRFVSYMSVSDGTTVTERVVSFVSSIRADQADAPLELIAPRKTTAFPESYNYYVPRLSR